MSANSAIEFTGLDFDAIRSNMKIFLSSHSEFVDYNFDGSTISLLLDLLAYNTYLNAYMTNMVGNEMFLDSAQIRENVVSRAKMLGYTPTSSRSATATFSVTVTPSDNPTYVTIARDTTYTATLDGVTYKFVTPQPYVLTSNGGTFSTTISAVEGEPLTHRFYVNTSNPVRYVLPNKGVDTTSIRVYVQTSNNDTSNTTYTLANDITTVNGNSNVYFLQETTDGKFEVYFGDNVVGNKPINGNVVNISYRVCNGTLPNGANNFAAPSTLGGYSTFTSTLVTSARGGANAESISSVKFNAPRSYEAQNRAVLVSDYERLILKENSDIASVSVWGGEDNDPPIYGKVYVSVKPTIGTIVSQTKKNTIKRQLKKYNVVSIDPEFVDASYLYVTPTIEVHWNSNLTTRNEAQVWQDVVSAVNAYETTTLGTFETERFRYSGLIRAVDNVGSYVTSNLISIKMQKRFSPSLTTATTYKLVYNNPIRKPISAGHTSHAGSHFISSSAFTFQGQTCFLDDDGEGIVRIYYLDGENSTVYLDSEAGSADYNNGIITLTAFLPTAYAGDELKVYAVPIRNDIYPLRNQIVLISDATVSMYDEATTTISPAITIATAGTVTTTNDDGVSTIVY